MKKATRILILMSIFFAVWNVSAQTMGHERGDGGGKCKTSFTDSINDLLVLLSAHNPPIMESIGLGVSDLFNAMTEIDPVAVSKPLKNCDEDVADSKNTVCSFPNKENNNMLIDCSTEKTSWKYQMSVRSRWQLGLHEILHWVSGIDDRSGSYSKAIVDGLLRQDSFSRLNLLKNSLYKADTTSHWRFVENRAAPLKPKLKPFCNLRFRFEADIFDNTVVAISERDFLGSATKSTQDSCHGVRVPRESFTYHCQGNICSAPSQTSAQELVGEILFPWSIKVLGDGNISLTFKSELHGNQKITEVLYRSFENIVPGID